MTLIVREERDQGTGIREQGEAVFLSLIPVP
jgi:hypothetical protein